MGDAIARFREMALAIRRKADENHSQPRGRSVTAAAAKKFAKECREHFLFSEKVGISNPAPYVRGLCKLRREAERHPAPPQPGQFDLPDYIEWLPEQFKGTGKYPRDSEIRAAVREAIREAVKWGSLFQAVEARIKALDAAADMLVQYAGSERYENPPEEDFEEHPEFGFGYSRPSQERADQDYIARHQEFAEALEALAPFIEEEPPAAAGSTPEEKKTPGKQSQGRSRKGVGGPKKKYSPKLRAAIITDRKREKKKRNPEPLKTWLTTWATEHNMKRADAQKMYNAEMAAIRRAQQARSR